MRTTGIKLKYSKQSRIDRWKEFESLCLSGFNNRSMRWEISSYRTKTIMIEITHAHILPDQRLVKLQVLSPPTDTYLHTMQPCINANTNTWVIRQVHNDIDRSWIIQPWRRAADRCWEFEISQQRKRKRVRIQEEAAAALQGWICSNTCSAIAYDAEAALTQCFKQSQGMKKEASLLCKSAYQSMMKCLVSLSGGDRVEWVIMTTE